MLPVLVLLGLLPLVLSLYFLWEGLKERDSKVIRGATVSSASFVLLVLLSLLPATRPIGAILLLLVWGVALALLLPRRPSPKGTEAFIVGEVERVDEREIPFARIRSLRPGTEQYRAFYSAHPELEEKDARRREVGLLGPLGKIDGQYEPVTAMVRAAMAMPLYLSRAEVYEPEPQGDPRAVDPQEMTLRIKGLARHLGADLVGICRLNPLWVYSHRGEIFYDNWEDWGRPIELDHPYAVVIATEMSRDLLRAAPRTPTTVESAINYAKGAYIATTIAHYIAQLGHRARAQHFRHYDLCLVPLAVDAGLGEVGRHGYLVTGPFGPRVRLAAVTTTLPLVPDRPVDLGVQAFCERCLKCARSCPSGAIPRGPKEVQNGILRWVVDREKCFDYWARTGTDCALCMAVCPYSRPETLPHRLARWALRRSLLAPVAFAVLDDLLYGKRWRPKEAPPWVSPSGSPQEGQEDEG